MIVLENWTLEKKGYPNKARNVRQVSAFSTN